MAVMLQTEKANLWDFILRMFWSSCASYAGVLIVAAARDITREQLFKVHNSPTRIFSVRTWHHKISMQYQETRTFFFIELVRLTTNVAVCVLYVYSTYRRNVSAYAAITNRIFASLFVLDILIGSLIASSALLHVFSFARFLQILSLPSLFLARGPSAFLHFGFLRAFSAYDAYIRMERRAILLPFAPKKFAARLFFQCLTLFYVLAAGIQMLEIPGDWLSPKFLESWSDLNDWSFFNCLYWVIVTLSTVGYGDLSPKTIQGRLYTLFMIIIGIIVFSNIIQDLFKEIRRQRGNGLYRERTNTRHVIVSGTPSLGDLVHFVKEFYNRHSNSSAVIVVLIEDPKWTDMDWYRHIARNHFLQNSVIYLVGSVLSSLDLQRAGINSADAVFILTSPASSGDPSEQDTQTVMSALAIRNSRTDIPIFSQTLLENSNVQIKVAMKTPASLGSSRLYRKYMADNASYRGIYKTVQQLEKTYLPANFRETDANDRRGASTDKDDGSQTSSAQSTGYESDLQRSNNVCLQQLYAALLVANIKANGVGTLCTNLHLELPDTQVIHPGHSWLAEYHLGAACSLLNGIIPSSLDGVPIKKVANLLFRRGIVIVATRARNDLIISTVLGTSKKLVAGEIGLFMTYLRVEHLPAALHLVGREYVLNRKAVLCANFKEQREKPPEAPSLRRYGRRQTSVASIPDFASKYADDRSNPSRAMTYTGGARLEKSRFAPGSRSYEQMGLAGRLDGEVHHSNRALETSFQDLRSLPLRHSSSRTEFPEDLERHIIVAMEGKTPLANLPFFLKLLWHKTGRLSQVCRPPVPVVVIHPGLTAENRQEFREYEGRCLFFVNSSPASRSSWMTANISTARAVATMADYTQEWRVSDARTIYTLLTLDSITRSTDNLFICSELIHEQSLEFLREPTRPRRRGAQLGTPLTKRKSMRSKKAPVAVLGSDNDDELQDDDEIVERNPQNSGDMTRLSDIAESINQDENSEEKWGSLLSDSTYSEVSNPEEQCATNALFTTAKLTAGEVDAVNLSRPKREYLFARYRYTSGELLVHSTADTLLVREYTEPGFVKFLTGLCGADQDAPGQQIRLVRIPRSVFREYHAVDGKQLIEFGIIFERLIALGVTPLGLYRSGDAPVRIPQMKRVKRGETALQEALLVDMPPRPKQPRHSFADSGIRPIRTLFRQGRAVLPNNVLSRRGQREIFAPFASRANPGGVGVPAASEPRWTQARTTPSRGDKTAAPSEGGSLQNGFGGSQEGSSRSLESGPDITAASRRNSSVRFHVEVTEYKQDKVAGNLLPYVFTLPDANTLVAMTDGVYILCDPKFELPRVWPQPQSAGPSGNAVKLAALRVKGEGRKRSGERGTAAEMYHGLRKALAPGVSRTVQKDTRVAAVEEAFVRLRKGIDSLQWALDNCERTWVAQSEFCKYLPLIAVEMYAQDDAQASAAIRAATDAASALSLAVSSPALAPVRSELSALLAHFKKLEELKAKWLNVMSDKAYYDDKYAKLAAALDKEARAPTARDNEREQKALLKKAHTSDVLDRISAELANEFDSVLAERLTVTDKVFLAVYSVQSGNARRADFGAVHDMLSAARFGARHVPIPARDSALATVLTGAPGPLSRSRSSSDASSSAALSSATLSSTTLSSTQYTATPPMYAHPQHTATTATYATAPSQRVPVSAPAVYGTSESASHSSLLHSAHHSAHHSVHHSTLLQPTAPHSAPSPPTSATAQYAHSWQQQSAQMQEARQARLVQQAQQTQQALQRQHAQQAQVKQESIANLSLNVDHLHISAGGEFGSNPSAPPEPPSPTDSIFTYFVPGSVDADSAPKPRD